MPKLRLALVGLALQLLAAAEASAGVLVYDVCCGRPHESKSDTDVWHLTLPFEIAGEPEESAAGANVANLLHLAVFRDLRRTDYSDNGTAYRSPRGFGDDCRQARGVTYDCRKGEAPPSQGTPMNAQALAVRLDMDLVLWGYGYRVGSDVVVQPMLGLPSGGKLPDWTVRFDRFDKSWDFVASKSNRSYELASLVISDAYLDRMRRPEVLPVCHSREPCSPEDEEAYVGPLGVSYRATQQHPDGWAHVVTERDGDLLVEGWVDFGEYEPGVSEASWFNSGVVRMMRHDWSGALDMFDRVLEGGFNSGKLNSAMWGDSLLFAGLAAHRLKKGSAAGYVERAWKANPYDRDAAAYKLALLLHAVAAKAGTVDAATEDRELCSFFVEAQPLFASDDALIGAVREYLSRARDSGEDLGEVCSPEARRMAEGGSTRDRIRQ